MDNQPGGMLQALRPRSGTSLVQLQSLLTGRGWRSALPSALPEPVLLGLARDLRVLESSGGEDSDDNPVLAGPLLMVLNLLMRDPTGPARRKKELQLTATAMDNALQAYQWAVEREIVTRIVGLGGDGDGTSLLKAVSNAAAK